MRKIIISFLLITIPFLISITHYYDSFSLLSGSLMANKINYPDLTNPFFLDFSSHPSLVSFLVSILIKAEFSIRITNQILMFFSTFCFFLGVYFISKALTNSLTLSFLISFTTVVLSKNFGSIDYPTLMFSEHSYGQIGLSLASLAAGLLFTKKYQQGFIVSILLVGFHLSLGLWMVAIIFISYLIFKEKLILPKYFIIKVSFSVIIISSFIFFNYLSSPTIPYQFDYDDYKIYINIWDAHRTNYGNLNYFHAAYIIKSFVLTILIIIFLRLKDKNIIQNFGLLTILLSIIFSFLLYSMYKMFPYMFPDIFVRLMPQRFFLIHSVIGYPLIICLSYRLIQKILKKTNINPVNILYFFIFVVSIHLLQHNESFGIRLDSIKKNNISFQKQNIFWEKVKKIKSSGYFLTSETSCIPAVAKALKPIIFCPAYLDTIPYKPKLVSPYRYLVENLIGINFKDPKFKNYGGINDKELKEIFEKNSLEKWRYIKRKFNVEFIIVPQSWDMNLEKILNEVNLSVYKIS